jgi:hypothetical protein
MKKKIKNQETTALGGNQNNEGLFSSFSSFFGPTTVLLNKLDFIN